MILFLCCSDEFLCLANAMSLLFMWGGLTIFLLQLCSICGCGFFVDLDCFDYKIYFVLVWGVFLLIN